MKIKALISFGGYREADLRLCFRICKDPVFSRLNCRYFVFFWSPQKSKRYQQHLAQMVSINASGVLIATYIWVIVKILVFFISYENRWCDHDFFFFTWFYWSYLLMLADKTEKILVCKYIFYWIKTPFFFFFFACLPVPRKKKNFRQELQKKTQKNCYFLRNFNWLYIKVNVGGFNMWFFITIFAFFFFFFC